MNKSANRRTWFRVLIALFTIGLGFLLSFEWQTMAQLDGVSTAYFVEPTPNLVAAARPSGSSNLTDKAPFLLAFNVKESRQYHVVEIGNFSNANVSSLSPKLVEPKFMTSPEAKVSTYIKRVGSFRIDTKDLFVEYSGTDKEGNLTIKLKAQSRLGYVFPVLNGLIMVD